VKLCPLGQSSRGGQTWGEQDILPLKLFNVSAASISSIDMPERTLAARCDRSLSALIMSISIWPGLARSEER